MAITDEQKNALANQVRTQMLEVKIAKMQGSIEASANLSQLLSSQNNDANQRLNSATIELNALKLDAGPGITDDFGERSIVDNAATAERTAGQLAVVSAIKATPAITEDEALAVWNTAALASRPPNRQWLLNNPANILQEYLANLVAGGLIADTNWSSLTAWVFATDINTVISQ
jgi:hypothetical protein